MKVVLAWIIVSAFALAFLGSLVTMIFTSAGWLGLGLVFGATLLVGVFAWALAQLI